MGYELQVAKFTIKKVDRGSIEIEGTFGIDFKRLTLLEGDELIITMPFGLEPKIVRDRQEILPK